MNDQLKRIKAKDYTQIDETLFANMARADNISSTLSHLSQFQQFLMQQISQLNHQPTNGKETLKSSINKNFDTLRESLVQVSRIRSELNSTGALKKKLGDIEDSFVRTKAEIKEEMRSTCLETKKQAEKTVNEVIRVLEREQAERKALEQKIQILIKEREMLYLQNEDLKKQKKQEQIDTFRSLTDKERSIRNGSECKSTILQKSENQHFKSIQREVQPLQDSVKNYGTHGLNSVPSFSEKIWKIRREEIKNPFEVEPRRYSLTRQTSNHRLASKQNINFKKENEALLSKGVKDERRKSKQKIKIFSLM